MNTHSTSNSTLSSSSNHSFQLTATLSNQHSALIEENILYITDKTPVFIVQSILKQTNIQAIKTIDEKLFEQKFNQQYQHQDQTKAIQTNVQALDLNDLAHELPKIQHMIHGENDAPIIQILNSLLSDAILNKASDIHIEPSQYISNIRFRIDGLLRQRIELPIAIHAALVSRLKVMANLDIAEKRLPQDGRIALQLNQQFVDVRLSCLPTQYGERLVMRLLGRSTEQLDLNKLGMPESLLQPFKTLIKQPFGIILVTGPTGSGKTTTLYAALKQLSNTTHNILTVEDPIEYEIPNISQTQVNAKIDLSFAQVLRAILRQDPDIIMIGEIRDLETAEIAIQSALTGHLVLATLHTNTAIGAITRLIDMGIEPFLLASTVVGSLAQRLVRRLCQHCKIMQADGTWQANEDGCEHCFHGYSGRIGIYELIEVDADLQRAIGQHLPEADIQKLARTKHMHSMFDNSKHLIEKGLTTLEEVLAATK